MSRAKVTVEYDGSRYCGFQLQPNQDTIEQRLNTALSQLFDEDISIIACSRTDSGVHAFGLVFHFDTDKSSFPIERLPLAIARELPFDIVIKSAIWVSDDFHARYSVIGKSYQYRILRGTINSAFEHNRAYLYKHTVDVDIMRDAARLLVGKHDFRGFMATGSSARSTTREITCIRIIEDGDYLNIIISADGFLYNMVRIIVGTLLDVARGFIPVGNIALMLASGERHYGGHTAPPHGLYLLNVNY